MTQDQKKPKRERKIGGIGSQYATLGSENGDGETVTPQEGQTVTPLSSDTVSPSNREVESSEEQKHGETVTPLKGETVRQQDGVTVSLVDHEALRRPNGQTVTPSHGEAVKPKKEKKITFYFTPDEEAKLDYMELEYRTRTGRRINRNDIIRYLLKQSLYIPDDAQFD